MKEVKKGAQRYLEEALTLVSNLGYAIHDGADSNHTVPQWSYAKDV
jgi:hypothetical protein